MKHLIYITLSLFILASCGKAKQGNTIVVNETQIKPEVSLTKDALKDKIMGGWAGQTIGCTYGGPTEFRFQGTMIQDYQPIKWEADGIKWWYDNSPGLYDDVYMDLTFVDVFERCGLDAPADSFALAFANAGYMLWHANQAARYNILNGIMPPQSGAWQNNPHADDIDYQIEADFAGLMSPAMPNVASQISDKIGHIMNYGDGWYGGVYVGAMYSLAFATDNVEFIVTESLKTIPAESDFYKCMNDVIQQYKKDPNDWKAAWFKVERDWSQDIGCPDGVFSTFNIDAKVNAAYIIIGLLYGQGDFGKTLDISMRCGQDSDCNPASAGGILGTMMGYNKIPDYWKEPLKVVEDMDFKYTTISLNDVYKMGFEQALKNIEKNGGKVNENDVLVKYTIPEPVKYEKSFENHYPVEYIKFDSEKINLDSVYTFEGTGVVVRGYVRSDNEEKLKDYVAELEVVVDDQAPVKAIMPLNFTTRKHEIFWMYNLQKGKHTIKLKWLNPNKEVEIKSQGMLIYSDALQNRAL